MLPNDSTAFRALRMGARTSALLGAVSLSALLLAGNAQAQAADDAGEDNAIMVTGSRIRTPDADSVSPVSTVGGAELQLRGSTRVEDLINTLPQAFADQGGGNRGGTVGASGTATINLRNLGNQRTLVLIEGRRLMQGDPARSAAQAADINNVPAALIQRIDIVTGGASAVYGSDALAGVVNFVMKRDFDGIQLDGNIGLFSHDNNNRRAQAIAAAANQPFPTGDTLDGGQQTVSLTFGKNFDGGRGNVTGYVGYRNIEGVAGTRRDFTTCNLTAAASGYACSLSSATYPVQFQLTNPTTGAVRGSYTLDSTTGNSLRRYTSADGFNNGNTYDVQAPDKRINADLFAHYELSDAVDLYGEFMFMRDKADIRISPTAVFSVSQSVSCSNPFLSASERDLICTSVGLGPTQNANVIVSQRNALGGSRHDYTTHTSYRGVLGARGEFAPGWRYDAYGQYGRTDYTSVLTNDYSLTKFARSLRATTDASGNIVCESALNGTDPSCVPLNLFAVNGITPEALNYIQNTVRRKGYTEEKILSGSITGDLGVTSPFATHSIGIALGAEYRKETISFQPDSFYSSRDVAGNSGGEFPISGSFDVKEVFGEIRVPLVENRPFFQDLALEGGFRYSDYSTAGTTWAFKAGGDWSPMRGLRLRASFQRAVRAPNLVELFGPVRSSPTPISDPCEGTAPRATFAQCALTGVTQAQYGTIAPAAGQQSATRVGGNPNLDPETSNTISFGGQYTPAFLPGVTFTADYFDIKVNKLIATVPAAITLNQCIATGDFCDQIERNPATGSLVTGGFINATYVNSGYLKTSGIDFSVSGKQDLADVFGGDPGTVSLNFAGTRTFRYETQVLPGADPYSCDGYFGTTCGQPLPHWRHRLLATWTSPGGVSLSATWRYIGSTKNDKSSDDTFLKGTYQPYDAKMKAMNYFDFAASIDVTEAYTLRFGVNNAFDRDPPITASTGGQTANTAFFGGMYDALGRYMFAGVTARF